MAACECCPNPLVGIAASPPTSDAACVTREVAGVMDHFDAALGDPCVAAITPTPGNCISEKDAQNSSRFKMASPIPPFTTPLRFSSPPANLIGSRGRGPTRV